MACWRKIGIHWDLCLGIKDRVQAAKHPFNGPSFIMVFICVAWHIWKQRNDMVFDRKPPSCTRWFISFRDELVLYCIRIKECQK
ncbi:hypothetical protein BRADI_3g40386v3 [Brachypodium distachyon]|uniref:Reverse transcriptase zinc-binding domain-containing protein n=1 Tax=Brachypodium distachyon TaxID=15368 RepID=A0A2K2D2A9_BRADI|nr:hypothetical protein BRADI_3g40386v3 [Brachypodium distachyon]